jgi:hypothetical protein
MVLALREATKAESTQAGSLRYAFDSGTIRK